MPTYARALGAKVGQGVDLHSLPPVTGMLTLGSGCSVEPEVDLSGHWLDGDVLHIGRIKVGAGARVGTRSTFVPGRRGRTRCRGRARVGCHRQGHEGRVLDRFARGARRSHPWPLERAATGPPPGWVVAYAAIAMLISLLPIVAVVAGLAVAVPSLRDTTAIGDAALVLLAFLPLSTLVGVVVLALLVVALVRLLGIGLVPGAYPVHSRRAWQAWATMRVLDEARTWLFPIYSSAFTPTWLRLLGARVGRRVEASTVLLIPKLTVINDESFLADDTLIGSYELGGGWLRVERTKIGKRAFVGNSGMTAPGRKVPKQSLVAVLSAAPRRKKAKAGSSWLGSPPVLLRRPAGEVDDSRTYDPPTRLRVARALVECCRLLAVMASLLLAGGCVMVLAWLLGSSLSWLALLVAGPVLMVGGALAAGLTPAVKWALVGRIPHTEHPLWSSFVWRSELADTFVEVVAAPWFARAATGTFALNLWLRSLGAGSVAGCGARPTGCPSPTSWRCATE